MKYVTAIDNIDVLEMSTRSTNALKKADIRTIGQMVELDYEAITKLRYLSNNSIIEVCKMIDDLTSEEETNFKLIDAYMFKGVRVFDEDNPETDTDKYILSIIYEMTNKLDIDKYICIRISLAVRDTFSSLDNQEFIKAIYKNVILKERIKEITLIAVKKQVNGLKIEQLYELLPKHLMGLGILEGILFELENDGAISIEDSIVIANFRSIIDFAKLLDERYRKVVLLRLAGKTLEEVGLEIGGVTRERVRQISQKALRNKPIVKEDKYLYIFDTYDISKEDFDIAFNEPDYVYNYLVMTSTAKNTDKKYIGEALEDENLSIAFRKGLEKATYKNYITASGERVLKNRPALVEFFVRNNCKELTSFKDFSDEYYAFLLEHDLNDKKYTIEERTYMNHLSVCDYALWNMNKSFRYYDINSTDKYNFIKNINLNQYKNKEISTLKIFRDYPELMKEYDLRDEYELHNYLKKIWPAVDVGVKFGRMPTLVIGEADKDQQALNLLIEHSPIGNYDLADLYEKEYGVKAYTAISNYFGGIAIYLYNSIYTIPTSDMPQLDEQQYNHLRSILTEDFYIINIIEDIFCKEYPGEDVKKINPYTLKKLGFMVYSNYVVSTRFESAHDYFRRILTTDDRVDAREWNDKMYLPTFISVLYMARSNFEIVEYLPLQYINFRKLAEYGITKEDLKDYANAVKQFVNRNQFFTIYSLRKSGFTHTLDKLGFDDWFYSSLLAENKENISYRRVGGDRLFSYRKDDIVYMDLIIDIVSSARKISLTSLQEYILQEYGFAIDKDNVVYAIKKSKLYYDGITKTIYVDYNAYLMDTE